MIITYGDVLQGRKDVTQFIINKKRDSKFTVIDVGSTAIGWTSSIADAFIDINKQNTDKPQFNFDICVDKQWDTILSYVEKYGKFDYSICTHTIEDIYNPFIVLDNLPKISKQGIITSPSVYSEINHVESPNWSGYIHHRYLIGKEDNVLIIAPKLPIIEKLKNKKLLDFVNVEDIKFEWNDIIPYKVFMNNYLGPDRETLLNEYENFIIKQLDE